MGICTGRTVIITGAGGGLGAAHAREFARAGANVVVNDINRDAAQKVVDEIIAAGGKAVVNTSDITNYADSENAVKQAIAEFGDLHVVLNNAGINRDRMFASLTEADWDAIMAVHLKGHFCISSHAVHYWRDQSKAGKKVDARIINTTSGAGLQGSVGQSAYSAAKGGIAALTLVQAAELARYGVTANALAPAARTSMTESAMPDVVKAPESGFDAWAAENVAPLVVWLGSELSSHVTGQVFESQGGRISVCDGWRTGPQKDKGARLTVQEAGAMVDELMKQAVPAQKVWGT